MKKVVVITVFVLSNFCNLIANNLNGTSQVVYASTPQVFHNGELAQGFVRLNNGFSLAPANSAILDTFITVSGGIDLKKTGNLILNTDLRLESNVTLTTGGIISGCGNAIVLGGDLTLAATTYARVLHIRNNTVIDGNGNTFIIGDRAQLFVDNNATLTLRNMTLKTGTIIRTSPIYLSTLGSKVALDNVIVELGSDFRFNQGQIFVHNDVIFTGTSALIYRSPSPSYITPGSTLMFDKGTTFSVTPATYTSVPYTQGTTPTKNNFLVMQDTSSTLFMNGSSLFTTYTGLRLTKGSLLFDNRVQINTATNVKISSVSVTTTQFLRTVGSNPQAGYWSPDGRYIGLVNKNTPSGSMRFYYFNGLSSPTLVGGVLTVSSNPVSTDWSPDGQYFIEVNNAGSSMQAFAFTGFSAAQQVGGSIGTGSNPSTVAFSRDGRFIASAITSAGGNLQVWSFDGVNTAAQIGSNVGTAQGPTSVDWSSDGRFIALAAGSGQVLQIYKFNGVSSPTQVGADAVTGKNPVQALWSPDARFIAVLNQSDNTMQMYSFNGTSSPSTVGSTVSVGTSTNNVGMSPIVWSPNGRYIAVVNGSSNTLQIFEFDGSSTPVQVGSNVTTGNGPISVDWSPDGNFLAVVNITDGTLQIFKVAYVQPSTPQAFSNALVFGDKSVGSSANLNVSLLSGAHVEVTGKISDDSV